MSREWSDQQRDIFAWFGGDRERLAAQLAAQAGCNLDFLLGQALAGTGKTTTVVEAINYAPDRSILLAAFNASTRDELKKRVPKKPGRRIATLHGVGLGIVADHWPGLDTEPNKRRGAELAARAAGEDAPDEIVKMVFKLAQWGKGLNPFAKPEQLVRIAQERNCAPDHTFEEAGWSVEAVARAAHRAMELACERPAEGGIDFDDMPFIPVRMGWAHPRYDLVVVDEYQDMGNVLLMLARRVCRKRLAFVGDANQAIYGFRGADAKFIANMMARLKPFTLPLTTTYRCPKAVVALAQKLVPDYTAAPSAPEGRVSAIHESDIPALAQPGDFILSRINAPLVKWCLSLIRARKAAVIEGRDIAGSLLRVVRETRAETIQALLPLLEVWRAAEIAEIREEAEDPDDRFVKAREATVNDTVDCLRILADGLRTVRELVARVETMFVNTRDGESAGPRVRLMTIHRAKGLEARRVFLLVDTLYPRKSEGDQEERNMHYVGITRAMDTLFLASQTPSKVHLVGTPAFRGDDGEQGEMFDDDEDEEEDDDADR